MLLDYTHVTICFFYFVFIYLLSEWSPVDNRDSRERSPIHAERRVQWVIVSW